MLVKTRNVDPRAPDLAPALRDGQTLWTFPLQKAQRASNASNDTDLCYPDTASVEKRIEKVTNDAMSVDRLLGPRSLRPPARPKFLWEQIRLRAKLKSPKLSSWEDCSPSRSTANNQKCSESSSRSLSPSLEPGPSRARYFPRDMLLLTTTARERAWRLLKIHSQFFDYVFLELSRAFAFVWRLE